MRAREAVEMLAAHDGMRIATYRGDFTKQPWPFAGLDGILMANSLHYVADQEAFLRRCAQWMRPPRRFLVVEYDTAQANPWIPHPASQATLVDLFARAGYAPVRLLRARPSRYRRAPLYAAAIGFE